MKNRKIKTIVVEDEVLLLKNIERRSRRPIPLFLWRGVPITDRMPLRL